MNGQIVDLVQRPYAEIVDDVLTAIIGGVVREPINFDVKQSVYHLSRPASAIRSVVGTRTPPPPAPATPAQTTFAQGTDYTFDSLRGAVMWQSAGAHPDDETTFYVDYARPDASSPLTDLNVGSVTRTLCEAIAREIATVYQQINQAYLAGFVDSATGQALDLVVSILGVRRRGSDYATGLLTFLRNPAVEGSITIAEGTEAATATGAAAFVTTDLRTLQPGQARIDVPIRAAQAFRGRPGVVLAGAITTLTQPIAGIASVANSDPTVLPAAPESDAQLRARAKSALQALDRATLAGLQELVTAAGSEVEEVWDPNLSGTQHSAPGEITILVRTEPARYLSLRSAVDEARAAGVFATVTARFVFFRPRLLVRISAGQMPSANAGKVKLTNQIVTALTSTSEGLKAGQELPGSALAKAVADAVPELEGDVTRLRVVSATAWRADVQASALSTTVDALLQAITGVPSGDAAALRTALTNALTSVPSTAPDGAAVLDSSLIRNLAGGAATGADLQAGKYRVLTPGADWQVVVQVDPTDVVVTEG